MEKKNQEQQQVNNEQQNVQATEQQPVVQQQAAPAAEQPKKENWFKKHWKAVAGGTAGLAAAVGSAIVAYRKGKQVGVQAASTPVEDYSLNPNE